jgi:hypothetical protein
MHIFFGGTLKMVVHGAWSTTAAYLDYKWRWPLQRGLPGCFMRGLKYHFHVWSALMYFSFKISTQWPLLIGDLNNVAYFSYRILSGANLGGQLGNTLTNFTSLITL